MALEFKRNKLNVKDGTGTFVEIPVLGEQETEKATAGELAIEVSRATAAEEALAEQVSRLQKVVGSPFVANTAASMTNTDRVYVYTGSESGYTAGNWYYYDGSAWVSGGVYNSAGMNTDTTLAMAGIPADAEATGEAVAELSRQLSDLDGDVADTQGMLAMVEATATASRNYSVGDLLIYDGKLYKVISAIATGATIIVGSNVTQTTVESQIAAGGGGGGGSEKTWRKFRDVTVTLEKPTSNVTYTEGADGITQFSFSVDDDGNSFEFTDIKILAIVKNITGAGLVTMYSGTRQQNIAIMTFRGTGTQGQARVYEFESILIDGARFYSGIYGTQYATTINQLAPNQIVNDPAFGGNYNNFLNGFVNSATLFNTVNMITIFFNDATVEGRFIFFGK